ncbi:hypothetical protein OU426_03020 [Frigidibacter sp. RF13]|uniref:hypothetical protein n=1 Tax=Frigidibacter sp. RF13 TaxID=2997340 RepID=UPI00226F5F32|nr:hypothetical protein [Frigidibacter sp. RF13]MCY1125814.1 hypothetical protein [Frigidibacter sp. RF13]
MRINFHLGVHATDDSRLIRAVLKNRGSLAAQGTYVPAPRQYRVLIRDALNALGGGRASTVAQQALIDTITDSDAIRRLVLSHESIIAMPTRAVSEAGLYVQAPSRMKTIQNLFLDHEVEFSIALCNPATLIAGLSALADAASLSDIIAAADAVHLSWLHTMRRICDAGLELPVTVWCNEDTPLIWPEVLRAITGWTEEAPMEGEFDLVATLLTDEGLAALQQSLADAAPADRAQYRARVSEALIAHGRPDQMEMDITLPGWTEEIVARITERYLREWEEICTLPGLSVIRP